MPPLAWDEVVEFVVLSTLIAAFYCWSMSSTPITVRERDRLRAFFDDPRRNLILLGFAYLGATTLGHDLLALTGWFPTHGRYEFAGIYAGLYAGTLLSMRRRARLVGVLPVPYRAVD